VRITIRYDNEDSVESMYERVDLQYLIAEQPSQIGMALVDIAKSCYPCVGLEESVVAMLNEIEFNDDIKCECIIATLIRGVYATHSIKNLEYWKKSCNKVFDEMIKKAFDEMVATKKAPRRPA